MHNLLFLANAYYISMAAITVNSKWAPFCKGLILKCDFFFLGSGWGLRSNHDISWRLISENPFLLLTKAVWLLPLVSS